MQRFYLLSDDMLKLRPDVFFYPVCGGGFHPLRERVKNVPIVVAACNDDLVAKGIVASLGRPGGNITGQSKVTPELASKRLSLATELVPSARRVAILWNPYYADFAADWQAVRSTASALNVSLEGFPIQTQGDVDGAFAAIGRSRADALVTFSDTVVHAAAKQVAELAARYRVPAVYAYRELPDVGGLVSYGPNLNAMFRAAARYVVRIFNGERPAEMPIEQPTTFELVINLKTAKALGLAIPPSVLARADQVIE
jgi:putative ABC transport system substrate-binding protein